MGGCGVVGGGSGKVVGVGSGGKLIGSCGFPGVVRTAASGAGRGAGAWRRWRSAQAHPIVVNRGE
eukprot:4763939-Alexandrium_andersonii.AAC.1